MDAIEKRIDIFEYVRDIPYSLTVWHPEDIESKCKGNCHAKSLYLRKLLEKEGYKIRNVSFPYKLRDFPDEVKYIPHQIDYHHALQIFLDHHWVTIDPTYDKVLRGSCFHVNDWDGISSTLYCENPIGPISYEGEENEEFQKGYQKFCLEMRKISMSNEHMIKRYSERMEQYIYGCRG